MNDIKLAMLLLSLVVSVLGLIIINGGILDD